MRTRCPSCKTIVNVPSHCSDYVHDCVNNSTIPVLQKEDVVLIGPWTDGDGSHSVTPPSLDKMPVIEGQVDIIANTSADFGPHDRVPQYGARGAPTDTTRERNRYTYFKTKEGQLPSASRPVNPNFRNN